MLGKQLLFITEDDRGLLNTTFCGVNERGAGYGVTFTEQVIT